MSVHLKTLVKHAVFIVMYCSFSVQWFGNLVTMQWWNDLWLNEGFATYMQYMSIETVFPELDMVSISLN